MARGGAIRVRHHRDESHCSGPVSGGAYAHPARKRMCGVGAHGRPGYAATSSRCHRGLAAVSPKSGYRVAPSAPLCLRYGLCEQPGDVDLVRQLHIPCLHDIQPKHRVLEGAQSAYTRMTTSTRSLSFLTSMKALSSHQAPCAAFMAPSHTLLFSGGYKSEPTATWSLRS